MPRLSLLRVVRSMRMGCLVSLNTVRPDLGMAGSRAHLLGIGKACNIVPTHARPCVQDLCKYDLSKLAVCCCRFLFYGWRPTVGGRGPNGMLRRPIERGCPQDRALRRARDASRWWWGKAAGPR